MPTIPIVDGFGLNVQAALDPNSAFAKYFQQIPSFSVVQQNLAALQNVPLTGFPLQSTEIGLSFTQPTALTSTSPQFAGGGGVSATLSVVAGGKLFDPDPYDSPIDVPSGRAYLGFGIKVNVSPGAQVPSGNLTVGFAADSTVSMTHYRSFAATATSPLFKDALQASVQNYVIPLKPEDLSALGIGDVAAIEGSGSLQLSGTVDLLTVANPLASISSAVLPATIEIQEGASVAVTASYEISGSFQVRIQKVDPATIRLGIYRKRGGDFTVQVMPSIGVTAGTTQTDFIAAVLSAISTHPIPPAELENVGLSPDQQDAISGALTAGIQRSLSLSLEAGMHALRSQEAAFLYDVSMNELDTDGLSALQNALRLNLTALTGSPSLPRGIREVQSVFTTTRQKGLSLSINLLGLYNFASLSDLTLQGTVLADPASGAIVITDRANATRISGAVALFADPDKLRKVLAQSFLITAAYRCSGMIAHAPSLRVSYWHFAEKAKTDRATMQADLNVLEKLGLISEDEEQQSLARAGDFGRSAFYLSTEYDDTLSQSLFLDPDGTPRQGSEYERIGRQALAQLIPPGGPDAFRLRPLQSDAIWQQVKDTGGTVVNLAPIFPDLRPDTQLPLIAGDYVLIAWWATAMAHMAQTLSAARRFFSQSPPPATDSPAFASVQNDLWHKMADVASNTQDRFSDPWGLLAMDLASGQRSVASGQIVSPPLTLTVRREALPNS